MFYFKSDVFIESSLTERKELKNTHVISIYTHIYTYFSL